METLSFDETALHPSARALLTYWLKIHPPGALPGRQHFDPAAILPLLPNIVLVEVHRDPLRFRYRVLGSRIDAANGKKLTGLWLDEAYVSHANAAGTLREYVQVVETGRPAWRRGEPNVVPEPSCRIIEVLRLPLAADGKTVDMVLGLTLYFDSTGAPVENIAYRTLGYASAESMRATPPTGSKPT
jgi:hypothetical protein